MSARWNSDDERRWWTGLADLLERRVRLLLDADRRTGPTYDPTKGGAGDGRPCSRCRKVSRSDARVCGSCGALLRMTP